jgi:uncharacterized membrane protein YbaN (DUF454 family)
MLRSEMSLAPVNPVRRSIYRYAFVAAGMLSLVLAVLGAILPGLPTTPFVLLAAACFAKGSPRWHAWLLANRWLGSMVRDWEAHHALPLRIKWLSSAMMIAMVGLSVWRLAGRAWLQGLIIGLAVIGVIVVWRIPTRR